MSEFERKTDGGLNAWIETYEAMGDSENDAEMLCLLLELRRRRENQAEAERECDELRAEQAEHDEQIARMEAKFSLAKRALDSKTARCDRAEAELRRRDAAEGEAVLYALRFKNRQGTPDKEINSNCLFSSYDKARAYGRGGNYVTQPGGAIEWVPNAALDPEVIPLYTAAPPAVLPPEMTVKNAEDSGYQIHGYLAGYNQCRADALELGAQPLKVVELPDHKFRECVNGLLEEAIAYAGTQQLRARLSSRLSNFVKPQHAENVKWEVKK